MEAPFYRKPVPAVGLAIGAAAVAHAANLNAANAVGTSPALIAVAVGLLLLLFGLIAA